MSEIVNLIEKYIKQGQNISITLNDGSVREGVLEEINDSGIVIKSNGKIQFVRSSKIEEFQEPESNHVFAEDGNDRKPSEQKQNIPNKINEKTPESFEVQSESDQKRQVESSTQLVSQNKNTISSFAFTAFQTAPNIPLPPADFRIKDLLKEDHEDLSKIKNKYEYAIKIKELNRINDLLPEVQRLAQRLRNGSVFYLSGILAFEIRKYAQAKEEFQKSFLVDNMKASIALAHISIQEKKWDQAVQWLIQAILHNQERPLTNMMQEKDVLIGIGSCLTNCQHREARGLGEIQSKLKSEESRPLFFLLLAYALQPNYPEAAISVYNEDIIEASTQAGKSPVFLPASLPEISNNLLPISTPIQKKNDSILFGHVTSVYPSKGFGFIASNEQEMFFFPISNVEDYELKTKLTSNLSGEKVSFYRDTKPFNKRGKYDVAKNINWIDSDKQKYPIEIPLTISLPKGDQSYADAKLAEQKGDFEKAENYYKHVISNKGRYSQSAVKDLATLLNRLERGDDAINLLDEHRNEFEDTKPLDNLKSVFYIKLGQYQEGAKLLRQLKSNTSHLKEKSQYVRQEAYCIMMNGDIDKALRLLKEAQKKNYTDEQITTYIKKLETIKSQNIGIDDEELLNLAGFTSSLPKFAQDLIQMPLSDFTGVDERAKVRGFFTKKDFREVEQNLDQLGGRRPNDKAKLLITLAAMTERSPDFAWNRNPTQLLGRALAFMGEAATYDGQPPDVRRYYLAEALALTGKEFDIKFPLSFLISTYLSEIPEPGEFISGGNYDVGIVLNKLNKTPSALRKLFYDLSFYETIAKNAVEYLLSEISKQSIQFSENIPSNVVRENQKNLVLEQIRKNKAAIKSLIEKIYSNTSDFEETASVLMQLTQSTHFELDKRRLTELANISDDISKYWKELEFIEKESRCSRLSNQLDHLREDIRNQPTHLSYELLLDLVEKIKNSLEKDFNDFAEKAVPEIEMINVLSDDYYILEKNVITLRLEITLKKGSAPIEGIDVWAIEEKGLKVIESEDAPINLRGGERKEVELKIQPSASQLKEKVFTIKCFINYRNRKGNAEKSKDFNFPIRLGASDEFSEIPNPYKNYAGGQSVDDPNMFKGRNDIINRIIDILTKGPDGQCFVLYGQKRSGKTSILNQIRRRLNAEKYVIILLSLGEIDIDHDNKQLNFIELCINKIEEYLEDELDISITIPNKDEIKERPNESLKKVFRESIKSLKATGLEQPKIILLIDEFTYVYEYIKEGIVSPVFMRTWKALLQLQLFNAVVVGQDSMPKFKQAFPNEFGVTHDERISYLSKEETKQLIEEPILFNGQSRFRGHAFDRLFKLTAGSPFYTNIICDRLVQYLNSRRAPFITEADVDRVLHGWEEGNTKISGLIVGNDILAIERFDPLITAAGQSVETFPREKHLEVLRSIATQRNHADIRELPQIEGLNEILRDLQEREIIKSDTKQRYMVNVGLFAEWLNYNEILAC